MIRLAHKRGVHGITLGSLLLSGIACLQASSSPLSPTSWNPAEPERFEALTAQFAADKPLASGRNGVVTGTSSAVAVYAGLVTLEQGGSAVDALLSTSLAEVALANGAVVSYAGILTLMYYDASTGKVYNLNGGYNTVRGETDPMSIPSLRRESKDEWKPSGRTTLVPGFMAAAKAAHQRFGRLPWASLFEPAIYYAENGHRLHRLHQSMIDKRRDVLSRLPETKAIFTTPDGAFYREGDLFKQPQLQTLRHVASEGSSSSTGSSAPVLACRRPRLEPLGDRKRRDTLANTATRRGRFIVIRDPVISAEKHLPNNIREIRNVVSPNRYNRQHIWPQEPDMLTDQNWAEPCRQLAIRIRQHCLRMTHRGKSGQGPAHHVLRKHHRFVCPPRELHRGGTHDAGAWTISDRRVQDPIVSSRRIDP